MNKKEFLPLTTKKIYKNSHEFKNGEIIKILEDLKNLSSSEKNKLYIMRDKIESNALELEEFLQNNKYMNNKSFSKGVLFSQEIKANNTIEGYKDDLALVWDIVNNHKKIKDKEKMQRIMNLYNGYKYIFEEKEINKENLRELYSILSKGLLSDDDINHMGKYYREAPVYIYYSPSLEVEPDMGLPYKELNEYMNELFEFINQNNFDNSSTSHFIKSQIMHFQFVNIHPYFDINGRTSRTLAMWYLLNNKAYPYIIFNRGISLNKNTYYKVIRDVKLYSNVTFFVNFMLNNVKIELEKEKIIDMIKSTVGNITPTEYQSLYYILSMNGLHTVNDFVSFYNKYNDKKKALDIYITMIEPLLEEGIILKLRDTNGNIDSKHPNFIFEINNSMYENNPQKIKKIDYRGK